MLEAIVPAAIGAADLAGGLWQMSQAKEVAKKQMEFQERMSNTAYQRVVKDMRAAGINPMLAVGQGGASSPSGAGYTPENIVGKSVSSAMQTLETLVSLKKLNAEASLTQSLNRGAEYENVGKRVESEFWDAAAGAVGGASAKAVEKAGSSGALAKVDKILAAGMRWAAGALKGVVSKKLFGRNKIASANKALTGAVK